MRTTITKAGRFMMKGIPKILGASSYTNPFTDCPAATASSYLIAAV